MTYFAGQAQLPEIIYCYVSQDLSRIPVCQVVELHGEGANLLSLKN